LYKPFQKERVQNRRNIAKKKIEAGTVQDLLFVRWLPHVAVKCSYKILIRIKWMLHQSCVGRRRWRWMMRRQVREVRRSRRT